MRTETKIMGLLDTLLADDISGHSYWKDKNCPFPDCTEKITHVIILNTAKTKFIIASCPGHITAIISAVKQSPKIIDEWNKQERRPGSRPDQAAGQDRGGIITMTDKRVNIGNC
jgi:hypothetical protein